MKNIILCSIVILVSFSEVVSQNTAVSPRFFPKMKKVQTAVYVTITTDEAQAKIVSRILQGIVNRDSAEIFLADDSKEVAWFKYSEVDYKRPPGMITTGQNRGLRTLFKNYGNRIDKLVVCNFEDNDYTFNMALNMAAVDNALPVSEALKNSLVAEFGWNKEIEDVRNKWANISDAYGWALENLMPKINKQILFSIGLRNDWRQGGWRIFDYAVASRSFSFWLNDETPTGLSILQDILRTPGYPKNSAIFGYGMHGDDLNLRSNPEGFGFLVSDFFPNASFYSSFPAQTLQQREGVAVEAKNNTIYVGLNWSDGDNIQFNHNATFDIFNQPARGQVPVSMTLSPALMEIAPFILKYYYENATSNDELMAGPSGVQYIQELYYKPQDYYAWSEMTSRWLDAADMHVTASSLRWPAQPFYNNGILKTNVLGTFAWSAGSYFDAYNWLGMPIVCTGGVIATESDLYNYLKNISPSDNMPKYTGTYLVQGPFGGPGYAAINRVVETLQNEFPGKYVFLRASDLMATAKQYFETVQQPFKTLEIPGRIEAEDYDKGGLGAAFFDSSKSNEGREYRTGSGEYVDIGKGGSNYFVGWTQAGEWINYTVNIEEAGNYILRLNYASSTGDKGLCVMVDDKILTTAPLSASGSTNSYKEYSEIVQLPEGKHNLKIQFTESGLNLDYLEFSKVLTTQPQDFSGNVYKIINKESGKALSLKHDNSSNGTAIVQKEYTNSDFQHWKVDMVGNAFFSLECLGSGLCASVRFNSVVEQYPFQVLSDMNKWGLHYQGDGYYTLSLKGITKIMETPYGNMDDNAVILIADIQNSDNQLFRFEEVDVQTSIDSYDEKNTKLYPYPVPFHDEVNIPFKLEKYDEIICNIYSISGTLLYSKSESFGKGSHVLICKLKTSSGQLDPSGLYFFRLTGKNFSASGKLLKQ